MTCCIYTGTEIPYNESNEEHIFPLTLGGNNNFTIRVSNEANSRANKELDEKLKQCIFLAVNRKRHNAVGHITKSLNRPYGKCIVGLNSSVVLRFDANNYLKPYSNKKGRFITEDEIKAEGLKIRIQQEKNLRLRFTAKIALGAGYFVYGNTFVENTRTEDLRAMMHYHGKLHNEEDFNSITSTGWFWPHQVAQADGAMHEIFQRLNVSAHLIASGKGW